jgi:hypothetical protein
MNYAVIAAAMQAEIDNPLKLYMPNSPGAFVRDRLFKDMYWEEATWFWSHYCGGSFNGLGLDDLHDLYVKLKALTDKEFMPDWGTRGT